jgi:hypothetical protein
VEHAADLQAACAALLPRRPAERTGELGPPAAERFDRIALQLMLEPDADPGSLLITEVARASDVLCALWLARQRERRLQAPPRRPRESQRVLLDSADGETHMRPARQARSWGVELSA